MCGVSLSEQPVPSPPPLLRTLPSIICLSYPGAVDEGVGYGVESDDRGV